MTHVPHPAVGRTLLFNGSTSVSAPSLTDFGKHLNSWELEFWMKSANVGNFCTLFSATSGGGQAISVAVNQPLRNRSAESTQEKQGNLYLHLQDKDSRKLCGFSRCDLCDDQWHHIRWCVQDAASNQMELWIDSALQRFFVLDAEGPAAWGKWPDGVLIGAAKSDVANIYTNQYVGCMCDVRLSMLQPTYTMIAHWPFSQLTGNVAPDLVGGHDGIVTRGHWDVTGFRKTALTFNGIDAYVDLGTVGNFGAHLRRSAIEFWIKTDTDRPCCVFDSLTNSSGVGGLRCYLNQEVHMDQASTGILSMRLWDSKGRSLAAQAAANVCDGQWHHIKWAIIDSATRNITLDCDGHQLAVTVAGLKASPPLEFQAWTHGACLGRGPVPTQHTRPPSSTSDATPPPPLDIDGDEQEVRVTGTPCPPLAPPPNLNAVPYFRGFMADVRLWVGNSTCAAYWPLSDGPGAIRVRNYLTTSLHPARSEELFANVAQGMGLRPGTPLLTGGQCHHTSWRYLPLPRTSLHFRGRNSIAAAHVLNVAISKFNASLWFKAEAQTKHAGLAPRLMGHWKFDGHADDCSDRGVNGTIMGDVSWREGGVRTPTTKCLRIGHDGPACVALTDSDMIIRGENGFCLAAWICCDQPIATADPGIGGRIITIQHNFKMANYTTKVALGVSGDSEGCLQCVWTNTGSRNLQRLTHNVKYYDGGWHHVACTYDHRTRIITLYWDGCEVAHQVAGLIVASHSGTACIGSSRPLGAKPVEEEEGMFIGCLADVRAYNCCLESPQILDVFEVSCLGVGTQSLLQMQGSDGSYAMISLESNMEQFRETNCALFQIKDEAGLITEGAVREDLNDGNWHHVIWNVEDASTNSMTVLINGRVVPLELGRCEGPHSFSSEQAKWVEIGCHVEGHLLVKGFKGFIADVAISPGPGEPPLALWRLDDGIGCPNSQDYSGKGSNLVLTSNTTWKVTDTQPFALHFDGTKGYVNAGKLLGWGPTCKSFIIHFWLKTELLAQVSTVFAVANETGRLFSMKLGIALNRAPHHETFDYMEGNTVFYLCDDDNRWLEVYFTRDSVDIFDNEWHHVIWKMTDASLNETEITVDGKLVDVTFAQKSAPSSFCEWLGDATLGGIVLNGKVTHAYQGYLKDFHIWTGIPGKGGQEYAHWPLDEVYSSMINNTINETTTTHVKEGCKWQQTDFPPKSLFLAGTSQPCHVEVPVIQSKLSEELTMSCWFQTKSETSTVWLAIVADSGWAIYVHANRMPVSSEFEATTTLPSQRSTCVEIVDSNGKRLCVAVEGPTLYDGQWQLFALKIRNSRPLGVADLDVTISGFKRDLKTLFDDEPTKFDDSNCRLTLGGGCVYNGQMEPTLKGFYMQLQLQGPQGLVLGRWPLDDGLRRPFCRDVSGKDQWATRHNIDCCWDQLTLPKSQLHFNGNSSRVWVPPFMKGPRSYVDGETKVNTAEALVYNASHSALEFMMKTPKARKLDEVKLPPLAAHFPFAGDTTDTSGNHHHAILLAKPVWKQGPCGLAVELNGVDEWIQGPPSNILFPQEVESYTILAMFSTTCIANTVDNGLGARVITLHSTDSGTDFSTALSLGFVGDGKQIMCQYQVEGGDPGMLTYMTDYADGGWHMIGCRYDGHPKKRILTLFYDGVAVNSKKVGKLVARGSNFTAMGSFCSTTHGQTDVNNFDHFGLYKGRLQDMRIYHTAISNDAISVIAQRPHSMGIVELTDEETGAILAVTLNNGLSTQSIDWVYGMGSVLFTVKDSEGRMTQARTLNLPLDGEWHCVKWFVKDLQDTTSGAMQVWIDAIPARLQFGKSESPSAGLKNFHACLRVGYSAQDAPPCKHFYLGYITSLKLWGSNPECQGTQVLQEIAHWPLVDGISSMATEVLHDNCAHLYSTDWHFDPQHMSGKAREMNGH